MTRLIKTHAEFGRFVIVGAASTALYFCVLFIAIRLGSPAALAGFIAYTLIMGANYLVQRSWTFRSSRDHRSAVVRFVGTHVVGIAINTIALGVLVDALKVSFILGQGSALALVLAWSYLAQKFMVFRAPAEK